MAADASRRTFASTTTTAPADTQRRPLTTNKEQAPSRARIRYERQARARANLSLHQPKTATIAYNAIAPMRTELRSLLTDIRQRSEAQAQPQARRSTGDSATLTTSPKALTQVRVNARSRGCNEYCCRLYSHRVTSIVIPWAYSRQERIAQEP